MKWRAGCAPASRWSWRLTSVHIFQVHYIAVCEKPELKNWYAFHLVKGVWRRFEGRVLKVAYSLIPLHAILATLGIMLNIAEASHDLICFKVSAFAFFLRFRVFQRFCMEQSYIVCDKRTSPPYKNRSYIHKTSDSLRWKFLSALCKKTRDKECVQFFPVSPPTRTFSCVAFKHFSYFWRQCCVCSSAGAQPGFF